MSSSSSLVCVLQKMSEKESQLGHLTKLDVNFVVVKDLVNDVMTHGADLKFINLSSQKFLDLSKVIKAFFLISCLMLRLFGVILKIQRFIGLGGGSPQALLRLELTILIKVTCQSSKRKRNSMLQLFKMFELITFLS